MPHAPCERTLAQWETYIRNMDRNERRSRQRRRRRLPERLLGDADIKVFEGVQFGASQVLF